PSTKIISTATRASRRSRCAHNENHQRQLRPVWRKNAKGESTQRVTELLLELGGELGVGETLVLRAGMLDLERAHQRRDTARGRPIAAAHEAVDHAGAIRVAAAG